MFVAVPGAVFSGVDIPVPVVDVFDLFRLLCFVDDMPDDMLLSVGVIVPVALGEVAPGIGPGSVAEPDGVVCAATPVANKPAAIIAKVFIVLLR